MVNAKKWIYFFESNNAEGSANMKDLLGGKGAGLAEMSNIGIPVPPGFTISTEACVYYSTHKKSYPDGLEEEIDKNLSRLEEATGKRFGDKENPLLVSVRSGAKFSMPGMMDTILNLGLNDQTMVGFVRRTNNERLAYDSYRRFIQMFSDVVLGINRKDFEEIFARVKEKKGVIHDTELNAEDLKDIVSEYKELVIKKKGMEFPTDPQKQLKMTIEAVFNSWNNKRAIEYRNLYDIPHDLGTAVNVQTMVFGNMGENSGTGVAFTRNPSTGEKVFYGEYLQNAQGEDVVAGVRTPLPINEAQKIAQEKEDLISLEELMPQAYKELEEIYQKLERHYKDMQDIEFTVEEGKLFLLQTRTGKRFPQAAVKIAVDMVKEGLFPKEEGLLRIEPSELDKLLHPRIDPEAEVKVIARGLPGSPGAVSGAVVFTSEDAIDWKNEGRDVILTRFKTGRRWVIEQEDLVIPNKYLKTQDVILTRSETVPDDVSGMFASQGVLTARGGMTSHAAVVARGMGKTCVPGCEALEIDEENKRFNVELTIKEGEFITLDGNTGRVIWGKSPIVQLDNPNVMKEVMKLFQRPRIKITDEVGKNSLTKGTVIVPGAISGVVAFDANEASSLKGKGKDVVLVCNEVTPQDLVEALPVVDGILTTQKGGIVAHPTVKMGPMQDKCAIVGCGDIRINKEKNRFEIGDTIINQGEYITLDGYSGRVIKGQIPIVKEISEESLQSLFNIQIDPDAKPEEVKEIGRGSVASPGVVSGVVAFDVNAAVNLGKEGKDVILLKNNIDNASLSDIDKIKGVTGILVYGRSNIDVPIGKCCISECDNIKIDEKERLLKAKITIEEGEFITLDGNTGNVILGCAPTIEPEMTPEFKELLEWADVEASLKVRANADTPEDARKAREFNAQGIGLCRTEHMFFAKDRLPIMQDMILATDERERERHLTKLLPEQEKDFMEIFKIMNGLPVNIRLLDPPLHEFLPSLDEVVEALTKERTIGKNFERIQTLEELKNKTEALTETNPMLGFRGCRLGVMYPEIYDMQIKAIFKAATTLVKEGYRVVPEVMIPLVGFVKELKIIKDRIDKIAKKMIKKAGVELKYSVGTMIEVPRAALTANEIAREAEFFSFGTNDLTQTVLAFSRDDAEKEFLYPYIEKSIFNKSPFVVLDREGVGDLIKIAMKKGRNERPDIKMGICGEHGGDPDSIEFCHQIGLDYVSCSAYRVPIARLAAAQARLKNLKK